jgi:hypothetical protein
MALAKPRSQNPNPGWRELGKPIPPSASHQADKSEARMKQAADQIDQICVPLS